MGRLPTPKDAYTIVAQDGADDDGGTLYVLYDNDRVIAAASWPQPLEEIARITGHAVFSGTYGRGEPDED